MKFSTASITALLASFLLKASVTTAESPTAAPTADEIGPFEVKTILDIDGNLLTDIISPDLDPFEGNFFVQRSEDRGSDEPWVTVFGMNNVDNPTSCEDGVEIVTVSPTVTDGCDDFFNPGQYTLDPGASCSVFNVDLNSGKDDYSLFREISGTNSETLDLCFRVGYTDPTSIEPIKLIAPLDFRVEVKYTYETADFTTSIKVEIKDFEDFSESQTSTFTADAYLCNGSLGETFEPGQEFSVCVELNDDAPVEFEATDFQTLTCAGVDLITEADGIKFPSITRVDEKGEPISFSQVLTNGMVDVATIADADTIDCTGVVNVEIVNEIVYKYYVLKSGYCPTDGYLADAEECGDALSNMDLDTDFPIDTEDMEIYVNEQDQEITPGCHYRAENGSGNYFAPYSNLKECDEEVPCVCRGDEVPAGDRRQLLGTSTRAMQTATETGDFVLTIPISSAASSSSTWFASTVVAALLANLTVSLWLSP